MRKQIGVSSSAWQWSVFLSGSLVFCTPSSFNVDIEFEKSFHDECTIAK